MMTEPEAWREVARRCIEQHYDAYPPHIITRLMWEGKIDHRMRARMNERRFEHEKQKGMAWMMYTLPRNARALAALWLALEAEEEGV